MISRIARRKGSSSRLTRVAPCLIAIFMAGVCLVTAGRGHLGSPADSATGAGTQASATFNPTYSVIPGSPETAISVASRLSAAIDADPNFTSSIVPPGSTTFEVLPAGGGDLTHLLVSENNAGLKEAGVSFDAPGRAWTALSVITSVAGNGNYRLIIDFATGADYDVTFDTTTPPNNTVVGLNSAIQASFAAAGLCSLVDSATGLRYVEKLGTKILSTTQLATDTGISAFTVDVTDIPPTTVSSCSSSGGVPGVVVPLLSNASPTLSEFGLFVLVLLLVCAALMVLRRKGARSAP